jgi:hypothetical protein
VTAVRDPKDELVTALREALTTAVGAGILTVGRLQGVRRTLRRDHGAAARPGPLGEVDVLVSFARGLFGAGHPPSDPH